MILYSHGDSVVWGAELKNKQTERFSHHLAKDLDAIDCNNSSAGVSNDYIYRQTMRDLSHWACTNECWSEEQGWVKSDKIKVIIGWTAPTRFEWWNGESYEQERLWKGYDKWGDNDKDRTTEDEFVLNQTEDIPSYIRTFNHVISLASYCEELGVNYFFFNSFYKYDMLSDPNTKIDKFGRDKDMIGMKYLWARLPLSFQHNMYKWLQSNNGTFHPRKHPTKQSHELWAKRVKTIMEN